jgi:chromosome segregation ATPase
MPKKTNVSISIDLEADVAALQIELSDATSEADRLADGRKALLLHGTDDELAAHDTALAAAGRRRDRAAAKSEVAEQQHAEAVAREAAESRAERIADANRTAEAAVRALTAWHQTTTATTHAILREIAEADALIEGINGELLEGEQPLARVESRVRFEPAKPAKVISEKQITRWAFSETGNPLSEEFTARVRVNGNDRTRGVLMSEGSMSSHSTAVELRRFTERRYFPAETTAWVYNLARTLSIPGLRASDLPVWTPVSSDHPEDVFRQLASLDPALSRGGKDREPLVELIPILIAPLAEAAE